ncbi:hypothetical protein [Chondromyces apiculatus]|uniref:Porin n=1 Tax=Chondromyces apiculatus DSM 436 TaxID=1192034 RepID=A0A017T9L6_9BACT|nr:hypothetical protein [Chondromyces apiculatus]EYF05934.1 Hypothetical protein CAP_2393 [Chondromyces apiculatus DSM 436]
MDIWFGGGASTLIAAERYPDGMTPESFSAHAQTEIGFRLESGPWYFRLDFDLQFASNEAIKPLGGLWSSPPWSEPEQGFKIGPPEWAMLQYSLDKFRFRGGVITSMIGLEDWDAWINVFPTRSLNYNVTPGRTVGAEVAYVLDSGYEFFVFGGCDLDWADCFANHDFDDDGVVDMETWAGIKAGAGITTIQDHFATWSGFVAMPNQRFYWLNLALEFYPHEFLTVDIEAAPGFIGVPDEAGTNIYNFNMIAGAVLNVLPAEPIHPMFRVHGTIDPNGGLAGFYPAYDGIIPTVVASAGVSAALFDGFKIAVEAKVSKYDFATVPGIYTGLSFAKPEPPVYSARMEEEEEEGAEAPAAASRSSRPATVATRPAKQRPGLPTTPSVGMNTLRSTAAYRY